jgi:predicted AAA+ superfamily ATPase
MKKNTVFFISLQLFPKTAVYLQSNETLIEKYHKFAIKKKNTLTEKNLRTLYNEYLQTSFPYAALLSAEQQLRYLEGIYATVVLKNIVKRLNINDVTALKLFIKYLYAETGSLQNVNKITNALVSLGNKITNNTVTRYIEGIEDSMLICRADRYNVKEQKIFANSAKYYAVDMGLRRLMAGDRNGDYGHILENIVYLELLRRDYLVFVGVVDNYEVDFVAKCAADEQNFNGIVKTGVLKWLLEK